MMPNSLRATCRWVVGHKLDTGALTLEWLLQGTTFCAVLKRVVWKKKSNFILLEKNVHFNIITHYCLSSTAASWNTLGRSFIQSSDTLIAGSGSAQDVSSQWWVFIGLLQRMPRNDTVDREFYTEQTREHTSHKSNRWGMQAMRRSNFIFLVSDYTLD